MKLVRGRTCFCRPLLWSGGRIEASIPCRPQGFPSVSVRHMFKHVVSVNRVVPRRGCGLLEDQTCLRSMTSTQLAVLSQTLTRRGLCTQWMGMHEFLRSRDVPPVSSYEGSGLEALLLPAPVTLRGRPPASSRSAGDTPGGASLQALGLSCKAPLDAASVVPLGRLRRRHFLKPPVAVGQITAMPSFLGSRRESRESHVNLVRGARALMHAKPMPIRSGVLCAR